MSTSRVEHRPLPEILSDIAIARTDRERADAALEKELTNLGLLDAAAAKTSRRRMPYPAANQRLSEELAS